MTEAILTGVCVAMATLLGFAAMQMFEAAACIKRLRSQLKVEEQRADEWFARYLEAAYKTPPKDPMPPPRTERILQKLDALAATSPSPAEAKTARDIAAEIRRRMRDAN